jgi:ribosomal protein S18 acetylase RimI-like enzyme
MIRLLQPLDCKLDFDKLTNSFCRLLDNNESFKFLSYSLIKFDKETIEGFTEKHKENGIDYILYEKDGLFKGILSVKRNPFQGFELFSLIVDKDNQKEGVGQSLINECVDMALKEKYKCIDTLVFSDNKNMLRLLIKNDFRPIELQNHARADGMDLVKLRKTIKI